MPTSRRSVIKSIATVAIATPVAAQHDHHAVNEFVQISGTAAPYKPKFFSKAELDTVRVLVELIIPRTDTPGAAEAGVDRIIDTDVSRRPPLQKAWRSGLTWVEGEARKAGGKSFLSLSQEKQTGILRKASEAAKGAPGSQFFTLLKGTTVDTYYSTKAGLNTELGWNANTFLSEFKGCTHKEHQV